MPYAVYSKRTEIVTRIVHDLSGLLPSESMIEVDDEIAFPRSYPESLLGQKVNTFGMKMFDEGSGVPTIVPFTIAENAEGRRSPQKHPPIFVQYPNQARIDLPIYAHPFGWKASELAQAKYETILAKNYPYHTVVGEEWINADHIEAGDSSDYVLSEGRCILNPGGVVQTTPFFFRMLKRLAVAVTDFNHGTTFVFDTYYLMVTPEPFFGISIDLRVTTWSAGTTPGFTGAVLDDEVALDNLKKSIELRFTNNTPEAFAMENYMLFLRVKDISGHG